MKTKQKGFSAVEMILVLLIIGIVVLLGWVYFSKTQMSPDGMEASKQDVKKPDTHQCKDGSSNAENGTFCSEDIGISVSIPDIFKGKLKKSDNYTIYTQDTIVETPKVFGTSDVVYEATIKGTNDEYNFTVSKEPLRNFRVNSYIPALFDTDTKQIHYDTGKEVESTILNNVKFYVYGEGDAGAIRTIYTAVINNKIIVISLTSNQELGDPATTHYMLDTNILFSQFKERIKSLKVV